MHKPIDKEIKKHKAGMTKESMSTSLRQKQKELPIYMGDIKTLYNIIKTLSRRETCKAKPVKDKDVRSSPS